MCYILKMRNFNRTQQKLEFQFTLGNKKLSKFACPVQVLHVVCYFNGLVSRSQGSENEKLHAQLENLVVSDNKVHLFQALYLILKYPCDTSKQKGL